MNDGASVRQRVAVRLAPRRLHRQLTKSASLGNLALFEVSPPQVAQMPGQKHTLLQGQAPAERESLFRKWPGFVELLLPDIDVGQYADGAHGHRMLLAEGAAAQFQDTERQGFSLLKLVQHPIVAGHE